MGCVSGKLKKNLHEQTDGYMKHESNAISFNFFFFLFICNLKEFTFHLIV